MNISYWYDSWSGRALAKLGPRQPCLTQPTISLGDAVGIAHVFQPEDDKLKEATLNSELDQIEWKWNSKGVYTARSLYATMISAGKMQWPFKEVWSSRATPTVRIFANLLLRNKILTHDVMETRRMNCVLGCVMCDNCPVESGLHLLFLCTYATHVWFIISNMLGYRIMKPSFSVQEVWYESRQGRGNVQMKQWVTQFLCTLWGLWKHRNHVVFGGTRLEPRVLAGRIIEECQLWTQNG
ncbi:uncharacterized protein LOC144552471 [Carex rostrata]